MRKLLIWRQKHCYSHPQTTKRSTLSVSKNTNQQIRRQTLEKISSSTPPLLTHWMRKSYLPFTRFFLLTKRKTKITIKILAVDENGDEAKTHLQWVSISFSKKKKKISPKLSIFTTGRKAIIPTGVLKRGKNQKTNNGFGNFHSAPVTIARKKVVEDGENLKSILAQVPCIQYLVTFWKKSMTVSALLDLNSKVNAIYPTFVKELRFSIRPTDIGT